MLRNLILLLSISNLMKTIPARSTSVAGPASVLQGLIILIAVIAGILIVIGALIVVLVLLSRFRTVIFVWLYAKSSVIRELALNCSKMIGRLRYTMKRRWILPVVLLFFTAFGVWFFESLQKFQPEKGAGFQGAFQQILAAPLNWLLLQLYDFITQVWTQWGIILAAYALILLLMWVMRARKRVVIEEFSDYGSGQPKEVVCGLARLLVAKLGQLRDLYQVVDEQRAVPTSVWVNQSIDATIDVGDVTELLKNAVSTQSELSLGPIKIPVGTLISLLGRFAQGPRVTGSLHNDGNLLILTAQHSDGKHSHNWRVEGILPQAGQEAQGVPVQGKQVPESLDAMVAELACRMFTDLSLNGSVRWRATAKFNEGLHAYRDCLRTPRDRTTNLTKAEKGLIETLAEDQKFKMAYYNLGVVYTELGQADAAEDAFLRAINQNPGSWNALYALAVSRFQTASQKDESEPGDLHTPEDVSDDGTQKTIYMSVDESCKRVIELKPGSANVAKAYQLRGLANDKLRDLTGCELEKVRRDFRKKADQCRRRAVGHAWRALCAARLNGAYLSDEHNSDLPQLESLAGVCLANQAVAAREQAQKQQDERGFKNAKKLLERTRTLTQAGGDYYGYYAYQLAETSFLWAEMLSGPTAESNTPLVGAGHTPAGPGTGTAATKQAKKLQGSIEDKYQEAVNEYKHAIRINPDRIDFRASLALAYAKRGKEQGALDECEQVLSKFSQTSCEAREKISKVYQVLWPQGGAASTTPARLEKMGDFLSVESEVRAAEQGLSEGRLSPDEFEKRLNALLSPDDFKKKLTTFQQLVHATRDVHEGKISPDDFEQKRSAFIKDNFHTEKDVWVFAILTLARRTFPPHGNAQNQVQLPDDVAIDEVTKWINSDRFQSREWEKGQIYRVLGNIYLKSEKKDAAKKAEDCFRKAKEALEKKYPQEIRLQKLPLLLARSLLMQEEQGKYVQALQVLKQALDHDSLEYEEREELGNAYFKLDEFDRAIEVWKDAISCRNAVLKEPDSPDIEYKIGNANVEKARHRFELEPRVAALEEAIVYLKQALDLYKSDQQKMRGYTCYLLGIVHLELCRYWDAISYLKMSKALGYPQLTSMFFLGYALLKNKEYSESIKQFRDLPQEVQKLREELRQKRKLNEAVIELQAVEAESKEILSVEPITLAEFEALGYWGNAFAIVESDGAFQEAQGLIQQAVDIIKNVPEEKTKLLRFPGRYPDCLGWVHYKLGDEKDIEAAIEHLKDAIAKAEDAEIYLHLALAYERQLQISGDKKYLQWAQIYSQHALDIDIRAEYKNMVENLQQRLMSFGQEVSAQKAIHAHAKSNGSSAHRSGRRG